MIRECDTMGTRLMSVAVSLPRPPQMTSHAFRQKIDQTPEKCERKKRYNNNSTIFFMYLSGPYTRAQATT